MKIEFDPQKHAKPLAFGAIVGVAIVTSNYWWAHCDADSRLFAAGFAAFVSIAAAIILAAAHFAPRS